MIIFIGRLLIIFSFLILNSSSLANTRGVPTSDRFQGCHPLYDKNDTVINLCFDTNINNWVVIKAADLANWPIFNEASILQYMQKNNIHIKGIVRYYETLKDNEWLYLVLEYCPGGNLSDLVKRRHSLPENEARRLFIQIIKTIDQLHDRKIAHRDIKLQNFMLLKDLQTVKVIDFGIADNLNLRAPCRELMGTPYTMAPEIFAGELISPYASDVFALGAILVNMVLGHPLYSDNTDANFDYYMTHGAGSTLESLISKATITGQNLPPLSKDFIYLIDQMMQKDPSKRPRSKDVMRYPWMKAPLSIMHVTNRVEDETSQLRPLATNKSRFERFKILIKAMKFLK